MDNRGPKSNDFTLPQGVKIPEEFYRIVNDFIADIKITFPEYEGIIQRWWKFRDFTEIEDSGEKEKQLAMDKEKRVFFVFKHCVKVFPERFFDILYKNVEIFDENSEINTEFLPGIVFKQLWYFDISDNTRETIWKYLQLILFSVIGSVQNTSELGDTAKLFEGIDENELKSKLQETLEGMQNVFSSPESKEGVNLPSAEDIHGHIHGMMQGKLGKLAMELAEETAQDLNLDMENVTNTQDVFQKLFSNPGKLMNMVKNVGGKIDEKIKSGEIKESELISEGMDLLNKMKGMPGMENMKEMFSKMGMPGLGKGAKLNTGAMEAQLGKNLKMAQMKERMKAKVEKKKASSGPSVTNIQPTVTEEELLSIFSTGEKVEKTPRTPNPNSNPNPNPNPENKKKKKKNKK